MMKIILKSILIMTSFMVGLSYADSAFEEDEEHEHHHHHQEAHEHGIAKLELVSDQTRLNLRLELPMINVTGFEHQAETAEEKQLLAQQTKMISQFANWAKINSQAACETDQVSYDIENHNHHDEHQDFDISFSIKCSNVKELRSIEILLFDKLPDLETVKVDWIHQGKQNTATLTTEKPTIIF